MLVSHRTWTEFLRQPADPFWWAKKAVEYQRKTQDPSANGAERAQQLAESIWLISSRKLSNRDAIKLLVSKRLIGREPSRALALFTARNYQEYLRPSDANFHEPQTRSELVRFLLRRRFTYYPDWTRERASRKRDVDMDSLPEAQIVRIVRQYMQTVSEGYSEEDALREIEVPHSFSRASYLPAPLTLATYIGHRINETRRSPLPDEFIEWAVEQAIQFFETHASPQPTASGAGQRPSLALQDARIERLRVLAERSHPESQYLLAKAFLCGQGVRQDLKRGLFWNALARRAGHAGAEILFEKIQKGITGTALERLLAETEAAADQYETFSDVKVSRGPALIAHSGGHQSSAHQVSAEVDSI